MDPSYSHVKTQSYVSNELLEIFKPIFEFAGPLYNEIDHYWDKIIDHLALFYPEYFESKNIVTISTQPQLNST